MKNLLPLLAGFFLTGCRAFDPALLTPSSAPLATRLPPLTPEVQAPHFRPGFDTLHVASDLDTLFAREVREVIAAPAGSSRGFAVLTTRCVRYGQGHGYAFLSGLTLGGLTLLGFPWVRYHCTLDVQLDIRNQRRELVGTYYAQGRTVLRGSLYGRTNYRQSHRVLYLQCVRQALAQIVPQIPPELAELQRELRP
ncbi:hypothetical protein [Hymenobacter edaphi]|uniref:Uncharacterized protein n=1 Tax=Hymenobacter edaphi TaxID=2211146 RepID=A0A328B8X7_9BACT|nr:hypothetical protein [Hymenobacter edaphi]RAK62881.1 hypothetical protein DLM85_22030 [Hymenobacter edaphi]